MNKYNNLILKILKEKRKQLEINTVNEKKEKRKKRTHNLIVKGTVFEILGLDKEENEFLIGLLLSTNFYELDENEKKKFLILGKLFLKKRGNLKKGEMNE